MRKEGVLQAEVEILVPFFDVDMMNIVWHGHYVKYFEMARCALLDKLGHNYTQMREAGYAWPVIDLQLRYVRGATFGQRILRRVAERFQAREVEEAAIAFDGVDEAENGIEPGAVFGRGFPGDDLSAQRLEHLAAFGNELGNQVVHRRAVPPPLRGRLWDEGVKAALALS